MNLSKNQINLDDLAAEAVRLGRELAERAHALHLGGSAQQAAFVLRCLARLKERQPFAEADEGGLSAVQEILERDIEGEIIGTEERFVETHFDELGQHGEIREVLIYSDRGAELIELRLLFCDFLTSRGAALDHTAAHRELMKIMSG